MDFANPLSELVKELWNLASKPLGYICNLKDNVNSLRNATGDLRAKSGDVKEKLENEEGRGAARCTNQVANWLRKVQEFEGGVYEVLQEAEESDQIKCLNCCLPPNCWSSYKLGKRVDQMLNKVRELLAAEEFDVLTLPSGPPCGLEMPMDKTVGIDSSLDDVLKWLVDENLGVIGLYGPGGVGKTTLMRRINNELSRANYGFEVIIWIVVSKQVNKDRIQDDIRKRLHIQDKAWKQWTQDEKVHHLWNNLTQKKFVLLIDDLWEMLDISKIGVPCPDLENGSKVVFTTRWMQVCEQMKAKKALEVKCLTFGEAFELFENSVGESTVHSHAAIPKLAMEIAKECNGLPLALITVGKAMAGTVSLGAWRRALRTLKHNPPEILGMEEKVYHILEFSYSSLSDTTLKLCFLYCCLFPEDYHIRPHNLIGLWIGEGLLRDTTNVYRMRDEGEDVLGRLKMACLLESGHDSIGEYVKMHDVIRDMAIWITHDHGQSEKKLLVIEEGDTYTDMFSKWGEVEKASLWGKWIRNVNQIPECSQLKTLFVRETNMRLVPREFFGSMTARLTVLDLSNNRNIQTFPEGICDLINLQYLNLSATWIRELPMKIKKLTCLRWLLLDDILKGILIPTEAIASLPLNVFSHWSFSKHVLQSGQVKEEEMIEKLGCKQHLTELSVTVFKSSSALDIFQSSNLRRRVRRVRITDRQNNLTSIIISYSPASSSDFSHLEVLYLHDCPVLVKMEITKSIGRVPNCPCFPSLVEVWVYKCELLDLSWLMHAPKLQELTVEMCDSMEKIISDRFAELAAPELFSHLQSLTLLDLPKLTSICGHALFFPHGASFRIDRCPGLRKLPLDLSKARGSLSVVADVGWWPQLEWDPAARVTFQFEETTFGEAVHEITDLYIDPAKMEFRP